MMLSSLPRIRRSASSRSYTLCKTLSASSSSSTSAQPCPLFASPPLHHNTSYMNMTFTDTIDRKYTTQHCKFKSQNHRYQLSVIPQPTQLSRYFSSSSSSADEKPEKKKDLRESIERLKNESNTENNESTDKTKDDSTSATEETNPHIEKLTSMSSSIFATISETWDELIASGQAKDINKKIGTPTDGGEGGDKPHYEDDNEAADKYEEYKGSKDIMLINPEEHLSAWERMERRLRDAPIIQDILEKSNTVYEKSGAKTHVQKTQEKMQHIKEDAEEAWETSQNPWVYRASSVYDTLTAESEFATASRQLQVLDPDFTMENWKRDVVEHTLPNVMNLFLEGRITELKPRLGEAVYNRLAAEVRARKKEGVQMDTNVLAIMNAEILACELGSSRGDDPIILLHFMCQQIHCVRKKVKDGSSEEGGNEDGKSDKKENDGAEGSEEDETSGRTYMEDELGDIVEGSEDDIRANSYVVAFQREYNEEKMELNWKIVDFRFNGAIAYL